ncbi:hypothetical protein DPEC_G00148570, partial [Dallia pectoralis]
MPPLKGDPASAGSVDLSTTLLSSGWFSPSPVNVGLWSNSNWLLLLLEFAFTTGLPDGSTSIAVTFTMSSSVPFFVSSLYGFSASASPLWPFIFTSSTCSTLFFSSFLLSFPLPIAPSSFISLVVVISPTAPTCPAISKPLSPRSTWVGVTLPASCVTPAGKAEASFAEGFSAGLSTSSDTTALSHAVSWVPSCVFILGLSLSLTEGSLGSLDWGPSCVFILGLSLSFTEGS